MQLRAKTDRGLIFESSENRIGHIDRRRALNVGDRVFIKFDASSVHVYPDGNQSQTVETLSAGRTTSSAPAAVLSPVPRGKVDRRAVFGLLGAASVTVAITGGLKAFWSAPAPHSEELNIYSWPDYFRPDSLAAYAKQRRVRPNISTYDSNDTLFAKLNSPAGAYFDIVVPSSGWIKQLTEKKLLQKLDHERLNLGLLDLNLLDRDYDPGNQYSIPKDWGVLGVVYDPDGVGGEIKTWQDFLDAGARPRVSGKVRLSSSSWETVGVSLWIDGKDWNTADAREIRNAGERIKNFAKHVKTFGGFDSNGLANGSILLAQCNQSNARAAIEQNAKLKWVVPGPRSELWVDSYAIAAHAPNVDHAYDFLAFQLQPEVQLKDAEYLNYPTALAGLRSQLASRVKDSDLIFGGKSLDFDALTTFVVNPETIGDYLQLQTDIQAAAGLA
jgi:spermidine/putrescine transport system substrate-binding protein